MNGGKFAAAGADGLMRVWNPSVSSEPLTFRADPQVLTGVSFSPDGFTLATTGYSGRVSLWNSSAGSETLTLSAPGAMKTIAFSPKGSYLASAGLPRGDVRVWDLDRPEKVMLIKGHKGGVHCVAFSPDGKYLATAGPIPSENRPAPAVRIVNFLHREQPAVILEGITSLAHALAWRPDGSMIASAGEHDEVIHLHDPVTGKLLQTFAGDVNGKDGHANGITCLAFSPDGRWLASGSIDKSVRLWNLETGAKFKLEGHTSTINAVAFNAEKDEKGKDILTLASASNDKTIRFWDVESRQLAFKLEGTPGPVQSLAFHPRGRRLVSIGQDRMIRLWDLVTRQEILEFEEHVGTLRCVAFSADGRSLAGAGNGVVRVWRASSDMPDARR
jgi:WD40 repeat protein